MKRLDPIARILDETQPPHVVEGEHRERLRRQLLAEAPYAQIGRKRMGRFSGRFVLGKAAAVLAAILLLGVGWASEKIYRKFFKKVAVTLERSNTKAVKLPNGMMIGTMSGVFAQVDADDPKALETAKSHHAEMKQLIVLKKYEFVRNLEYDGRKEYVYKFKYSDGSNDSMNFSLPLDTVASWEDYQRKVAEREKWRTEQIGKALGAGRYRLIDMDATLEHICLEVATQRKYRIHRIVIPDSKDRTRYSNMAMYYPFDFKARERITQLPQTSWQEYLDAVQDGRWQILSADTAPVYKYEVVLDDQSKTIFRYGGGKPLQKPKPLR